MELSRRIKHESSKEVSSVVAAAVLINKRQFGASLFNIVGG